MQAELRGQLERRRARDRIATAATDHSDAGREDRVAMAVCSTLACRALRQGRV